MAEVKGHSEPTMEEILASIRRIIAEDDGPQTAPSRGPMVVPPAADKAASADSTEAMEGAALADAHAIRVAGTEPATRNFPPIPPNVVPPKSAQVPPVQEAILDLTERLDQDERPAPLKSGSSAEPLSAAETARRSAGFGASISALTRIASTGQSAREPELPLGNTGRTLEEMVRELLRPHLKEWLDAHLPRLVERMVKDEINRLVRDAQQER
jgi:hypothetical protein